MYTSRRGPSGKKVKICEGIDAIVDDTLASPPRPVQVRTVAQVVGRLMATHVAVGDAVRRMTRDTYAFVARVTGVPPDATRR